MYKTLCLLVIKVGEKWCQATKTWKICLNFLAKSLFFSRYPRFSPFERPDAYRCYTFSESYGSRETRDIKSSTSKFDIEARGILSSLWTQTGPWSDTASYSFEYEFRNSPEQHSYFCHIHVHIEPPAWYMRQCQIRVRFESGVKKKFLAALNQLLTSFFQCHDIPWSHSFPKRYDM